MTQLSHPASPGEIRSSFFDNSVIRDAQTAVDFIGTILESSTEYSIIGTDLEGTILLWNEGARRLYGYEPDEVVGKFTSAMLHTPDEVAAGTPREILDAVLRDGKWEGTLTRLRKSGEQFTARVVVTPRHDRAGAVGYLLISKDITGEIRMTEELEATQSYTRSLVESNIDALITTDPLGVITDVNQQMETLTDRGREALVGTPLKDYFTEPDRVEDCIRLVLREGKVTDYELTARRPDGSMTVVSYNASTFYNNDGKLRGVFATARDVTDKRLLAHERRESEAYNRGLIEASADGLIMVEPSGTISDVNEQMCRMMGYSREELVGSGFPDYFVDAERARAHIAEIFAQGVTRDYIQTLATSTGDEIEMWFNASVLRDQSGEVQGLVATARDITETARVQSEVTEERAYFRGLIEASLDLLVAVDPTLVITDVNDTMCRMSGYARDELIGTPFQHYFTDPKRAAACVRQTLDRASVTDYELTLRTNTGVERLVSFNAATFEDTSGGLRGIIATARDITGQARLRSELTEERAYNRGLIEASVDGIITVDAAMTITDVNERMCTMVGRPRQQLISTPFADYFDERELAVEGVRQTFEAGSVTNHVLTLRTSHGTTVPVSINAAVYRDVDDAVLGVFASARDITAQNQLEKELREQHFYTRSLIESNIDATVTTDPVGVVTDVNEQMETLTGRSREQLIGTPFKSYFTDPDRAEDGIREVLREGRVTNYELTARRPDGSTTVVSYNNSIFYDHDGKLRGVFGAARDITEQKRMEEELQEQQTYLRGLIEASFDGLITVDQEGYITDVNDRICVMSGYDRAELIGTSFSGYFTDPGSADSGVRDTFETGFVSEHELTLVSRSRRQLRVSINASIFRDDAGDVRGIVASARDITERVRLETQLREQQTYLRGLIESSADGLATVDPEGYVTDVNEEMCRMTGWARDELVGTLFRTYFTDPQRAEEGVLRTLADGVVTNFALELRGKSGRKATVSVNSSVFRGADGEMQGIVASARDISEQARLQTELGEQQAYNRSLIESSADAFFVIAPDGVITDINAEASRLTRYSRKHLVNLQFADLFTETEVARKGVEQTFGEGQVFGYELVLVTSAGRRITVSVNAGVFSDAAGAPLGILASARDITAWKELEEQLRAQQLYTRSMIESNVDALWTTDPVGIVTDVNEQMETLTGRSRAELIGTPFKDYVTEPARAEDGIRLVLREGIVTDYELTARRPDNSTTVVSYNASTFYDRDQKLLGVFASARDVTERKRSEEELRQKNGELERANLAKDRFLASMSHELRTPLNAVIGFTGTMLMGLPGPLTDDQTLQLKAIQRGGRHLLSLINDLLDLAKIEAGKLELTLEPVSCKSVIDEVAESLRPLAEEKQLAFEVGILAQDVVVLADRRALSQILLNLVNNAIKFTKEGQVTIELPPPETGGRVEIRVRDTGIGIDDDGRNRLFEAFEQLTPGDDRQAGTGLGLHVSSKLAALLDATISCDSEVGVGSSFSVSLRSA